MFELTGLMILVLASLLSQFTSLPGLLLVAGVLQAGSVLNVVTSAAAATGVSAYGLTPFQFMAPWVILLALWRFIFGFKSPIFFHLRLPLIFLASYVLVAISGSYLLPKLFAGIRINSLIQIEGIYNLSFLSSNLSHFAQALMLLLLFFVLLSFLLLVNDQTSKNLLIRGLALSVVLVISLGTYEQLVPYFKLPSISSYWANNPGYSQAPVHSIGFFLNRVGMPFSEPSYASAFMATITIGSFGVALLGRRWLLGVTAAIASCLGLFNSLGSTGLAAAGLSFSFLSLWVLVRALMPSASFSLRVRASILCAFFLLVSTLGLRIYDTLPQRSQIDSMVQVLIINKVTSTEGVREKTNQRALEILFETKGLGVGMGSHRASSFFAGLLSNTGVLGFSLFLAMLVSLLWRYWRAVHLSDMQIFVATALPTATLAMGLGIPDLNMPMYWGFIFLGFVFCPGKESDKKGAGDGCPPVRV